MNTPNKSTLAIDRELHDRVKAYSIKSGMRIEAIVSKAIKMYLPEVEKNISK